MEVVAELSQRERRTVLTGGFLALCLLAAFTAHVVAGVGGPGTDALFNTWVYNALMLTSAAACLLRAALVRRERGAWALLGAGLLLYTGGGNYFPARLAGRGPAPTPPPPPARHLPR